ncbi:MAG: ATP-binding protein, partial [Clostridia bacterium]|nr:ATP-binding protein [Clostridia bacterium]
MKFNSFCAANSGDGFVSLFDSIIDEKENKVYYIKGGPGSGKSTFLHSLAERSEDAELIYCSGDPSSLDGVILPKQKAVVIDATAPHCHEPRFPGIGGEIIDLGVIWKSEL